MKTIPCLSIRQPWAWAIVHGYKPIENRTWNTGFRGRLLIHAGKTWKDGEKEDLAALRHQFPHIPWPETFDLGGIVGEAVMLGVVSRNAECLQWTDGLIMEPGCRVCGCTEHDCRQCVEKTGQPCSWADAEKTICSACAPWFCGPFGFVLIEARVLPFTPWRGSQGFFNVPTDALHRKAT